MMERPGLEPVHGVPMLDFIAREWSRIERFAARPGDIVICSFPKAGTTWMEEVVELVLSGVDVQHCRRAPINERVVFLEWMGCPEVSSRNGIEMLEDMPSPRIIKTHLPYKLMPPSFWEHDCKLIYVVRNAKDSAVSYFHFDRMNHTHPDPGTWDSYLTRFLTGNLAWGSWFDHVNGWWEACSRHRILVICYEDMKENLVREVSRVAQFLAVPLSGAQLQEVATLCSFEILKDNPMVNYSNVPSTILNQHVSPFMRKGVVGDWKNHFSAAQLDSFEKIYEQQMSTTDLRLKDSLP